MSDVGTRIVVVGHVDHGKSTLIGRLLHDTHSLADGKEAQIRAACAAEGMDFEFAFLMDALLEEQEQNITIDTTRIPFRWKNREFAIIDAPGHKEFLKNMITGAAGADAAILLVDALEGVREQTRRHGLILSLLGIQQVIVAVNKMDLIQFDPNRFESIRSECQIFLESLGVAPAHFIPISAKQGVCVTDTAKTVPWYKGPSILEALDTFQPPLSKNDLPLRFAVQDIYRFDKRRIIAGRIESGQLRVGDELVFHPGGKRSRVRSMENWPAEAPVITACNSGMPVAVTLDEQIFVERGQVGSHADGIPIEAIEFEAKIFWLGAEPLRVNRPVPIRLGAQTTQAKIMSVRRVVDSGTLEPLQGEPHQIGKNEVADVTFRAQKPLAFDNAERIVECGRFVIMNGAHIAGGGVISGGQYPSGVSNKNLVWSGGKVTRADRARHFGHRGAVLWLTGLSGAGKSTLATHLEHQLLSHGVGAFVLDGDNLRHDLNSDLGFSNADRAENIRRAASVARLMAESGLVAITALISPFESERRKVVEACKEANIPFALVFIRAPLEVCAARDPKGLYAKTQNNGIANFTGITSPYEEPATPDLILDTDKVSLVDCVTQLKELAIQLSRTEDVSRGEEENPATAI